MQQLIGRPEDTDVLPVEQPIRPVSGSALCAELEKHKPKHRLLRWHAVACGLIRETPLKIAPHLPQICDAHPWRFQPCRIRNGSHPMLISLAASVQQAPHERLGEFEPQPVQKLDARGTNVAEANLRSSPETVKRRRLSRERSSRAGVDDH